MSLYQDTVRSKINRETTLLTVCNAGWSVLTEGQGATGPQAPPPTDLTGQGWLLSESDDSERALEETQRLASATRNPSAPFLSVFVFVLFFEWWRLRRDTSNVQMSPWGNRGCQDVAILSWSLRQHRENAVSERDLGWTEGVCFIFKIRVFRISGAGGKEPRKRECLKICIDDQ